MYNHREIQLHTIIKTLQSKVHALKRQLATSQQNQTAKLAEATSKERSIIEEKDKAIQILMDSVKKLKQDRLQHQSTKLHQLADDYHSSQSDNISLRANNNNLQQQLSEQIEHYQRILSLKENQLRQTRASFQIIQKERKRWLQEAQKLNRFYVQATRKQPERQETLLWVDKLIQFMTKASQIVLNQKKQKTQAIQSFKKYLKEQFYQLTSIFTKSQTQLAAQRAVFLKEMQRTIQQAQLDYKAVSKSNEQFWQNLNKTKYKEDKEIFFKLEQQFQSYRAQKDKQIQELNEIINNTEKKKKTLLVGLQQIKSYYQLRQKAQRQEVDLLKQTISDLIESQEVRESQFEQEIQRLADQIQHLTVRFYQKIELPINAVYTKIRQEVQKFKNHFEGFFSGDNFQTQIRQFHTKIVEYLVYLNQHKAFRDLVKDSAQECLKIAAFLKCNQNGNFSPQNSSIATYSSLVYQSGITVQGTKQRQQKLSYELAVVKKQLQKMKEHVKQLEKKSTNKAVSMKSSKQVQLMAENELYKERIQKLKRNEKEGFAYNQQILEQSRIGRINTAIIERLVEKSQQLLLFAQKEKSYIFQLSKCINSLNLIIINPLQTFQNLVREIKSISAVTFGSPLQQKIVQRPMNFDIERKKELFREISLKKNEAGSNIQKSNLQLMKVIRQFLSKTSSKSCREYQQKQPQKFKSYQSRQMLQKRLKEAHNQRIKNREQLLISLRQLQQKVKSIQSRYAKKQSINFSKYEDSILKAIEQLSKVIEPKQKFRETKKIVDEALLDTKSKLLDCQLQNEGLVRELQLWKTIKAAEKPK